MQEAAKIARANGTKVATFAHSDPEALEQTLQDLRPYRCALVCIDGVYSMSGRIPPMAELDAVARGHDAVLYIDDAHGTGVLGEQGRGTVLETLGSYENTFVIGSLSKAFSCAGGFIGCPEPFHRLLKIRCAPYIFGGPVVPSFLEAIGTVIDILRSDEYPVLRARLDRAIQRLTQRPGGPRPDRHGRGDADRLGLHRRRVGYAQRRQVPLRPGLLRPVGPVPGGPYHAGVLRIQCNANHDEASIDGLIAAFAALKRTMALPAQGAGCGCGMHGSPQRPDTSVANPGTTDSPDDSRGFGFRADRGRLVTEPSGRSASFDSIRLSRSPTRRPWPVPRSRAGPGTPARSASPARPRPPSRDSGIREGPGRPPARGTIGPSPPRAD